MPTYEYECRRCGHSFERFQSITAAPVRKCPKCGGDVSRVISAGSGVIFKGPGFYATDYRSEDYRRRVREEDGGSKSKKKESGDKES